MKKMMTLATAVFIAACSTHTYVSQENVDKYTPIIVQKFVIEEALVEPDVLVHFGFDQSTIDAQGRAKLDAFSKKIRQQKGEVIISGHTDLTGSSAYNDALSYRRSLAIAEYLKKKEPRPNNHRYTLHALGKHHPLLQQVGTSANAENRRGYVFFKPS